MEPCLRCSSLYWGVMVIIIIITLILIIITTRPKFANGRHLRETVMSQAFVVVGGLSGGASEPLDSVITLLPDASSWTELLALPTPLTGARASIVGGNIRLVDFVLITLQDRSFPI